MEQLSDTVVCEPIFPPLGMIPNLMVGQQYVFYPIVVPVVSYEHLVGHLYAPFIFISNVEGLILSLLLNSPRIVFRTYITNLDRYK